MARGLAEREVFQTTLRKGRSNEGVYYYVHWANLQVYLHTRPYDDTNLHQGCGDVGAAAARCRKQQRVVRIQSFVASGLRRLGCIKDRVTLKYLGVASFDAVIQHIEAKMHRHNTQHPEDTQMTFDTIQLDHIKLVQSFALDMNHYSNLQPMLAQANLSKSAKWSSADERFWRTNIYLNAVFTEMYSTHTSPQTLHRQRSLQKRDPVAFAVRKQECRRKSSRHMGIMPKNAGGSTMTMHAI